MSWREAPAAGLVARRGCKRKVRGVSVSRKLPSSCLGRWHAHRPWRRRHRPDQPTTGVKPSTTVRPLWLMHSIGCTTLQLRALRRKPQYWFHRGGSVIGTWVQRLSASVQLASSLTTPACLSYELRGGPSRLPLRHGLIGLRRARAWPVLLPPCPILREALLRVARIIELDRPGGCLRLDQRAEAPAAYALAGGIHAVHSRLTSRSQGSPGTCPRRP